MKKTIFVATAVLVVSAGLAVYYWFAGTKSSQEAEEPTVRNLVENFGKKLQMVSLQAPKEVLEKSMRENYGDFVSPELLSKWIQNPSIAPGRIVSSPWPDRIEINSLTKVAEAKYELSGEIIEITSVEAVQGGVANKQPLHLTVEKRDDRWLITGFAFTPPSATTVEYNNTQYGFNFSLPDGWEGYSVVVDKWAGNKIVQPQGEVLVEQGPQILIRHPQSTPQNPRQDVPIMVFTLDQWNSLLQGKYHVSAAPVNPSELGRNTRYVFALPARYNYAFPEGWEDVEQILQGRPLRTFEPAEQTNTASFEQKLAACHAIPHNSTQKVVDTTRLFINLPKDIYPDKEHNLQFKTVSGNAFAGWISNAGPPGEAFEATPECWSYYYEFGGKGEVDLTVKSAVAEMPDYFVRFIVVPTQ